MAQLGKTVKGKGKSGNNKKKGSKDGNGGGGKQTSETTSSADKALEEKIRRMKENDAKKRLSQAARGRLEEQMEVELRNTQMNKLRIQNQWRKIMRMAKVESLRKDIEILSQNHERDVDRKDAIIQMLDQDLAIAEDQYQMALRSHLQNIDRLIELQESRLLSLENEFESELATVSDEFNAEREQIVKQHKLEKQELLDIMKAVGNEEQERETEAKQEHEQTREEIRNKNLEDINVLRITLESTIEELERHFESAHLNYLQNTDQRTQDFKFLTRKDQELSKEIETKIRKIEKLQTSLAHWRTKINQNVKESEERNAALREEKEQIANHFQQLKARMNKFRDQQAKRLADLTKNVRSTKNTIGEKLSLAKRILKLAEHARKLETEQEKTTPFYDDSISNARASKGEKHGEGKSDLEDNEYFREHVEEQEEKSSLESKTGNMESKHTSAAEEADAIAQQVELEKQRLKLFNSELQRPRKHSNATPVDEWESLDQFYKRFNKVLLEKLAVEREKDRLTQENQDLQAILKQYLDGITVNPDVLDTNNPLLVVNGRIKFRKPQVQPTSTPCVIEASHIARRQCR